MSSGKRFIKERRMMLIYSIQETMYLELKEHKKVIYFETIMAKVDISIIEKWGFYLMHFRTFRTKWKGLDVFSAIKEMCATFAQERGVTSIKKNNIISLRKGFNMTRVAVIMFPADTSQSVVINRRIRIASGMFVTLGPRYPTSIHKWSRKSRRFGLEDHIARYCQKRKKSQRSRRWSTLRVS